MKISMNWLKEYLPVDHTVEEIANKLSLTGIESGPVKLGTDLSNLVVGHITSVKPHPNSDHLNLCQVDVGQKDDIQIVCGAPNVAADQYVIVALDGATLPAGKVIKRGEIRGEESNGMICGLDELGVSESLVPKAFQKGIYVFPAPEKTGSDAKELLGLNDQMVDLDITPNRADTLGMRGAAWEIGATYDKKPSFTDPKLDDAKEKDVTDVHIEIKSDELVTDYLARTIAGVKVGQSPLWMQRRLWNQGIQPVNNVIDSANYVMIEYGEPIQVYDLDKLTDKTITVENATDGHKLVIDKDVTKDLNHEDLVIDSGDQTIGLAGVTNGQAAAVTADTTNILIESAIYDGTSVRKAAQRHDLRGDASNRFEKGVDTGAVEISLNRTVELIDSVTSIESFSQLIVAKQTPAEPTVIKASVKHINHLMGITLTDEQMIKILDRLGFSTVENGDELVVTIPTRRWDMSIEADLIEEIMRIYGYENLKGTLPAGNETAGGYTAQREFINKLKSVLLSEGMNETITFGLVSKKEAHEFNTIKSEDTRVLHPMTEDHEFLRTSLIPGLVKTIAYNKARKNSDISIFEQGRIFDREQGVDRPKEIEYISGAITGNVGSDTWNTNSEKADFYNMKGIVQELLRFINASAQFEFTATKDIDNFHPGQTAVITANDQVMGYVGKLHPHFEAQNNIDDTFVFELNVDALLSLDTKNVKAQSAPKYPSVSRDLAILVEKQVASADIVKNIFKNGGQYLKDVTIFDVYQGSNIEKGHKSLGYHLIFQNPNDTLTDDTVEKAFAQIKTDLIDQFNVEVR